MYGSNLILPTGLLVTHCCNPQGRNLFIDNDSGRIFLGQRQRHYRRNPNFSYGPQKSHYTEGKNERDGLSVDFTSSFNIYLAPNVCHKSNQWG